MVPIIYGTFSRLQKETGEFVPVNVPASVGVDFHEEQPEILIGQFLGIGQDTAKGLPEVEMHRLAEVSKPGFENNSMVRTCNPHNTYTE